MYHPEHLDDYFKFFLCWLSGTYAFVYVNDSVQSKQMAKSNHAEFIKQDFKGNSMPYKVGSMIRTDIDNINKSK